MMAAPVAILFMFFQKKFIAGLTRWSIQRGEIMKLDKIYEEKVYAGVLGKIIGVYLGRPFEGWTYERIMERIRAQ